MMLPWLFPGHAEREMRSSLLDFLGVRGDSLLGCVLAIDSELGRPLPCRSVVDTKLVEQVPASEPFLVQVADLCTLSTTVSISYGAM